MDNRFIKSYLRERMKPVGLLAGAVFGKLVRPNILLAQGLEKVGFLAVYGHGSAGRLRRHRALC